MDQVSDGNPTAHVVAAMVQRYSSTNRLIIVFTEQLLIAPAEIDLHSLQSKVSICGRTKLKIFVPTSDHLKERKRKGR